ncbi:ATPase (plasmid) [Streptomyces sp. NEAU-sy36]|uniref:RapZ C-terminal domain-containing protein n=1 Tax=unclassified Streptomyces TaxID=2593676 RepID=UPI0015D5E13A|nr:MULTISPECIES: RNase adapter RapZ [unclassified Streptomyces]QLJ06837.1 ATPase [Streptomyces sp. NEAU-sy36]
MATIQIISFGYGHNPAPTAHITLDLRHHFRDPHIQPSLRTLTANDRAVRRTVLNTPGIRPLLTATTRQINAYAAGPSGGTITVATGCVGGRHRSAVTANALARRLRRRGHTVTVEHRDLHRPLINH